jgi:hypothetical protein
MANDEVTVKVNYEDFNKRVDFSKQPFKPFGIMYALVSDMDMLVNHVTFKKDVPTEMTGLLASLCLKNGKGHIKRYNPKELKLKKEKEEFENLKKEVEELKAAKAVPSEEPKKEAKPTTKKKTK